MASPQIGKVLMIFGVVIVVVGLVLLFFDRIPFLGKLPGDISFRHGNTSIYFPIVTCIIISIILTVFLNLLRK
jgi:tellurite resistance protein TehA-like permease